MFICDFCLENVDGRMFKKVTKKRDNIYTYSTFKYFKGEPVEEVKTYKGWEIVEECSLCNKCYNNQVYVSSVK